MAESDNKNPFVVTNIDRIIMLVLAAILVFVEISSVMRVKSSDVLERLEQTESTILERLDALEADTNR